MSANEADTAPHFVPQRENNAAQVSPKTFSTTTNESIAWSSSVAGFTFCL